MSFELPSLPFDARDLEPHISAETLSFHHGKHHNTYVSNLNKLIADTPHEKQTLDEIVVSANGGVFNNAAQHWNHSFYWNCLTPKSGKPEGTLLHALTRDFGSVDQFLEAFNQSVLSNFGSGWTWLVRRAGGVELDIINTSNAANPITEGHKPLLVCDVWEHAYYIDFRNARAEYVNAFWHVVNWDFVLKNFDAE